MCLTRTASSMPLPSTLPLTDSVIVPVTALLLFCPSRHRLSCLAPTPTCSSRLHAVGSHPPSTASVCTSLCAPPPSLMLLVIGGVTR
nr:ORF4 [Lake Sinai virus]